MERLKKDGKDVGSYSDIPTLKNENALFLEMFLLLARGRQGSNPIADDAIHRMLDCYEVGINRIDHIKLIRNLDNLVLKKIHARTSS